MTEFKEKLLAQYPYKIELHAHTAPASKCGKASPEEMIAAYKAIGYDAIVLTNHYFLPYFDGMTKKQGIDKYLEDYSRACAAAKDIGIKVFLGAEIRLTENENDYLLYGVDESILEGIYHYFDKGLATLRKEVDLKNSVFIQAHPYRPMCERMDAELLDGIEILNMHPSHNSKNSLAMQYAIQNDIKIQIVGSDSHELSAGFYGTTAIRTRILPENSFELAKILRSNDFIIQFGNHIVI